jgi:hypothetical protein
MEEKANNLSSEDRADLQRLLLNEEVPAIQARETPMGSEREDAFSSIQPLLP